MSTRIKTKVTIKVSYKQRLLIACSALLGLLLVACSSTPHETAAGLGMSAHTYRGKGYDHQVFRSEWTGNGDVLHVYIEGDGLPWIDGRWPSQDPTPRNPIALRLMGQDAADTAYIGRPCYFGHYRDPSCNSQMWTFERYSQEVVRSMVVVAERLIEEGGYMNTVLVGYSGGGVLALLMAPEIDPELTIVSGILTVAANLDTDVWTAHHGYLPLRGSLNPALLPSVPPAGTLHVQALGLADSEVPPLVTQSYRARDKVVEVWEYPGFDHRCCWEANWPELLSRFTAKLSEHNSNTELANGISP